MITTEQLQLEVGAWSRRNFPNNLSHVPFMGMLEEFGELCYWLKMKNSTEIIDAFGDILIYCADYCERNDLLLRDAYHADIVSTEAIILAFGKLSHFHIKGEQGIRYLPLEIKQGKMEWLGKLLFQLKTMAAINGVDVLECANTAWERVKLRDWQKNPLTAAKIADAFQQQ